MKKLVAIVAVATLAAVMLFMQYWLNRERYEAVEREVRGEPAIGMARYRGSNDTAHYEVLWYESNGMKALLQENEVITEWHLDGRLRWQIRLGLWKPLTEGRPQREFFRVHPPWWGGQTDEQHPTMPSDLSERKPRVEVR